MSESGLKLQENGIDEPLIKQKDDVACRSEDSLEPDTGESLWMVLLSTAIAVCGSFEFGCCKKLEIFAMGTEILRPHNCLIRHNPFIRNPNPNFHPKPFKKRRLGKSFCDGGGRYVVGQVKILKRGEPIGSPVTDLTSLFEAGTDVMPVKIRIVADNYAGSAFSASPSPRSLPLPRFSRKEKEEENKSTILVDLSATNDLRRLLGLQ